MDMVIKEAKNQGYQILSARTRKLKNTSYTNFYK